jgi:alkylhydroperoxidase family enzyme
VADGHAPDEVYAHVRRHVDEQALVHLTLAVVAINGRNRLAISCRWPAGGDQPERSRLT